jgi:hypothetical protein
MPEEKLSSNPNVSVLPINPGMPSPSACKLQRSDVILSNKYWKVRFILPKRAFQQRRMACTEYVAFIGKMRSEDTILVRKHKGTNRKFKE